jgi:hypothetical protein
MGDSKTTGRAAPDWSDLVGPLSVGFRLAGKGRCFFPGILISPRLIKIAIASRMSSPSLRLFRDIKNCYGIPRTTLKEPDETKFPITMENGLYPFHS